MFQAICVVFIVYHELLLCGWRCMRLRIRDGWFHRTHTIQYKRVYVYRSHKQNIETVWRFQFFSIFILRQSVLSREFMLFSLKYMHTLHIYIYIYCEYCVFGMMSIDVITILLIASYADERATTITNNNNKHNKNRNMIKEYGKAFHTFGLGADVLLYWNIQW